MFQLYLLLRLKNFGRIIIELGIFRIVFLTILTVIIMSGKTKSFYAL